MTTKLLAATASVALLLATTACGGSTRPSAGEISATLQKGVAARGGTTVKLTEKQADCAAKVFMRSSLSDKTLRAIADGDKDVKPSKKDAAALTKVTPELAKCGTG